MNKTVSYRYDLTEWIESLPSWLDGHKLADTGQYCRFRIKEGRSFGTGVDLYACAGAANILYTIGSFPDHPAEKARWIATLQSFQDSSTGIFTGKPHSYFHATAYCTGALELFDARPLYPFVFMEPLLDRARLEEFLDELDWEDPWNASHIGAGCCAAYAITGYPPPQWFEWYFSWLNREVDPETGFWRKGYCYPPDGSHGLFGSLAGGFHYLFNYEYFRLPMPYPHKVVDTCLLLLEQSPFKIGAQLGYSDIDWIYCLTRALWQSGHRRDEALERLWEVCGRIVEMLNDPQTRQSRDYDDIHVVFGTLCAVAELQRALPGSIRTPKPLKLVLDRRPFI